MLDFILPDTYILADVALAMAQGFFHFYLNRCLTVFIIHMFLLKMSNTFEVMFDDLKPEVQRGLLEFLGVTENELNKEIYVIAVLEKPEEANS